MTDKKQIVQSQSQKYSDADTAKFYKHYIMHLVDEIGNKDLLEQLYCIILCMSKSHKEG